MRPRPGHGGDRDPRALDVSPQLSPNDAGRGTQLEGDGAVRHGRAPPLTCAQQRLPRGPCMSRRRTSSAPLPSGPVVPFCAGPPLSVWSLLREAVEGWGYATRPRNDGSQLDKRSHLCWKPNFSSRPAIVSTMSEQVRRVGRPRQWASEAERNRAYRARRAAELVDPIGQREAAQAARREAASQRSAAEDAKTRG